MLCYILFYFSTRETYFKDRIPRLFLRFQANIKLSISGSPGGLGYPCTTKSLRGLRLRLGGLRLCI